MKTVEFEGTLAPNGQIAVPPQVAQQIPAGEPVHVVVFWEISNLDADWKAARRRRFEATYAPEDSIYAQLIDDAPDR